MVVRRRPRIRQLSVAMFDSTVSRRSSSAAGARVTDKLLASIARSSTTCSANTAGWIGAGGSAGQRFFVFWADTGPHGATSVVERIRQAIAKTHFELPQGTIELTFSAAVTEVLNDDTTKSLFTATEQDTSRSETRRPQLHVPVRRHRARSRSSHRSSTCAARSRSSRPNDECQEMTNDQISMTNEFDMTLAFGHWCLVIGQKRPRLLA